MFYRGELQLLYSGELLRVFSLPNKVNTREWAGGRRGGERQPRKRPLYLQLTINFIKQEDDEEANANLAEGEERKKKTVPVTSTEFEVQNSQKPLWMRPPSKVNPKP